LRKWSHDKQQRQKFSPEVRERAVRMVIEHRGDHTSQWAAIVWIAANVRRAIVVQKPVPLVPDGHTIRQDQSQPDERAP